MCFFSPWNKSEYRRTIRNRAQQLNKTSFHMVTEQFARIGLNSMKAKAARMYLFPKPSLTNTEMHQLSTRAATVI